MKRNRHENYRHEKYSGSDKPANVEVLTLKVSSAFRFNEVYEKFPLAAFSDTEKDIFNELLDDNKVDFELSFEKDFHGVKRDWWLYWEKEEEIFAALLY